MTRRPVLDRSTLDESIGLRTPMYGKGVMLANIRTPVANTERVLACAMDLIPSLRRYRDTTIGGESGAETHADLECRTLPPINEIEEYDHLEKRLILRPQIADSFLSQSKYSTPDKITRSWRHRTMDSAVPRTYVSRRAPVYAGDGSFQLDSLYARQREVRRVLSTAKFLLQHGRYTSVFRACLEQIRHECEFVLAGPVDSNMFYQTLQGVVTLIRTDGWRNRVWNALAPVRERLVDMLSHEHKMAILQVLEEHPALLSLYGNNLVLLVLAIMDQQDVRHPELAVKLWRGIGEWQLYQMGLPPDPAINTKYDVHALYSNLRARLNQLLTTVQSHIIHGQLILTGDYSNPEWWLVLLTDPPLVALIQDVDRHWYRKTWYPCVTEPAVLMDAVERARTTTDRRAVILDQIGTDQVLWVHIPNDEGPAWIPLLFRHNRVSGGIEPLSWLLLDKLELMTVPLEPNPPDIGDKVNRILDQLTRSLHDVIRVECFVEVDREAAVYDVELIGEGVNDHLTFERTSDLIRLLRDPIRRGGPYQTSDGHRVRWSLQDISLDSKLGFLRPVLRQNRFLEDIYRIPSTCRAYLSCGRPKRLAIIVQEANARTFSLKVAAPPDSWVKRLETVPLSLHRLGILMEAETLVDEEAGVVYEPDYDVTDLRELAVDADRYPRLHDLLLDTRQALADDEDAVTEETRTLEGERYSFVCWMAGPDGLELHLFDSERQNQIVCRPRVPLSELREVGIHLDYLEVIMEQWLSASGFALEDSLFTTVLKGLKEFLRQYGVPLFSD